MDRIRIGIIGTGIMADLYAKIYSAHPLSQVVAVCSRTQAKVDAFLSRHQGTNGYTDYRTMLEGSDLDAVVIATPDHHHFAPAQAVLESGRHAFVEKPFTTSVAEADELIRIAGKVKKKVQVAFNHRWLSAYHQAKTSIAAGEIGTPLAGYARKNDTIYVPTEYISWAAATTPAWFLSSHDIDLMRWFVASDPVEVRAWGRKEVLRARGIDTYDIIQAQVRFASGAIVTFESAWIYPNTFPSIVDSFIEVLGSAGHIHLDRKCESVELSTEKKFSYPKGFLNLEIFGRMRGAFPSCLEDFLYAILDDTEPKVTAWDGRQVTATLEAIHRSLESGADEKIATKPVGRETYARS
ncbi:MAG: gfo/Idh/MocA family oxidoreductase [Acidobacteria bacterium]|nr:MAG: gfo/Idh/MocA family oxidoreductase [Acidobacteriota bacterium]PYY04637.1 MAG: gfo/Idh/MocA family oxidoreductase [Acidobacteriota bacterium]